MPKRKKPTKKIIVTSARLSKRSVIIFVLIFATIGSYFIWRSLAASGTTLTPSNLVPSPTSVGTSSGSDYVSSSKKLSPIISLGNSATSKAVFRSTAISLDPGIYSVCISLAKVPNGTASGSLIATAYNNGAVGTAASTVYSLATGSTYTQVKQCITNLQLNTTEPGIEVTVSNNLSSGNTINLASIGVLKTGNISSTSYTPPGMRTLPDPLYGITVDDGMNGASAGDSAMTNINNSAKALTSTNRNRLPITRMVFDENTLPSDYQTAVSQMQPNSYLIGELLDSSAMAGISVSNFSTRVKNFVDTFGNQVDLWEVGNEINGEWLGTNSDVVAKMNDAYSQVKSAGKRTALTFYYNPNCWSNQSNEMFTWINNNVSSTIRQGLDYVLISYYEQDCNNHRISASEANSVFGQLHSLFPNARLGFGEVGLGNDATVTSTNLSTAQSILNYYYSLKPTVTNYVGGYFWWHYYQDMLPYSSSSPKPMWKTLDTAIQGY